jgi:hypothetical protein
VTAAAMRSRSMVPAARICLTFSGWSLMPRG